MTTRPVAVRVSAATRLNGSCARHASRMASEIWSAILSGCPSVTDSDVNKNLSRADKVESSVVDEIARRKGLRSVAKSSGLNGSGGKKPGSETANEYGTKRGAFGAKPTLQKGKQAAGRGFGAVKGAAKS